MTQARPLAFIPVYARRWHAYSGNPNSVNYAIRATKGWDR